jgi:hypothetical protein
MIDDDALQCVGLTIYTERWLAVVDPGAPPGYAVVCARAAVELYGPVCVPDDAALAPGNRHVRNRTDGNPSIV